MHKNFPFRFSKVKIDNRILNVYHPQKKYTVIFHSVFFFY